MQNTSREIFTIPKELVKKLEEHKLRTLIPKSALVSKLLKEFFEKEQKHTTS